MRMSAASRILIVDDDAALLEGLQIALEPTWEVFTATNGLAALEAFTGASPDLVLLDHRLPDIPGLAVLRLINQMSPETGVILITGYGSEELAVEAFRGGVRDYLKKPIDLRELRSRVELALQSRPESGPTPVRRGTAAGRVDLPPHARSHLEGIEAAIAFISRHLNAPISLEQVSREAGMSKFRFCRYFKEVEGQSFRAYLTRRRIQRALELLRSGERNVSEVYLDVGFKDLSHFSRVFRRITGKLPSHYRRSLLKSLTTESSQKDA
jgi:YesN/AraC family two-component response regulator